MPSEINRIENILESINFIEEICKEQGGIKKSLDDRKIARPAIMMHLISMQEQLKKLGEGKIVKAISQRHIKGLTDTRNEIAHNYEGLNLEQMADTLRVSLQELKAEITSILREFESQTPSQKLSNEIAEYLANKDIYYAESKLKKEQKILALHTKLQDEGTKIDDKDLEIINAIKAEQNAR